MKRYILAAILSIISLTASAKGPGLNVEKMFDGSYNSNPSVSLIETRTPEKYFRGCTVTDDAAILSKVTQLYEKDLPRAVRSHDSSSSGSRYRTMRVMNNGEEIYIGLSYDGRNGCYLFISGPAKAFK